MRDTTWQTSSIPQTSAAPHDSAARSEPRRRAAVRPWRASRATGFLFILPAFLLFLIFLWIPIIKGFIYSFFDVDFVKGNRFVGLANYQEILSNPDVKTAVRNTLYYMALCLAIGYWVPCLFAIAVSELRRFQSFARVAAYLPNVIPAVVLYGIWMWLYDPVGPFNAFLKTVGLKPISFLTDPDWSMVSIVLMETWQQFGAAMLIYLAGILAVPKDLYEAAEIDGAGVWARIRHITLPAIRHLLLLMLILQLIATSQAYLSQQALLDGGPNNATMTYTLLSVKYAFSRFDFGAASALGVLMFVVLSGLAFLHYRLSEKERDAG